MIVQNQYKEKLPGSCCFQLSKTTAGAAWCSSQAATAAESAACTGTFDMKTIRHWLMGKWEKGCSICNMIYFSADIS